MNIEVQPRGAWLKERRSGIGASDSAVVLGLSPFKTPYELWAEKVGVLEQEDEPNEAMEFGIRLEKPIGEAFEARTGRPVWPWEEFKIVRHEKYPWMLCTPDAKQYYGPGHDDDNDIGLLQIKTTSAFNSREWEDGPPLYYQVQVQHELFVTGWKWGSLVVLIGGQKLRYWDIEPNPAFIEALLPKLERFWRAVEEGDPPPVDGSLATAKVLARLHPDDNGETVELSREALEWDGRIEEIGKRIKALQEEETLLKNQLREAIGDATFGLLPGGCGRWSWKTSTRKGYTVEPTTNRTLRRLVK